MWKWSPGCKDLLPQSVFFPGSRQQWRLRPVHTGHKAPFSFQVQYQHVELEAVHGASPISTFELKPSGLSIGNSGVTGLGLTAGSAVN